jgi:hypothetical protein
MAMRVVVRENVWGQTRGGGEVRAKSSGIPRNFFWRGVLQIQLRTEGTENRDLGAVAP